MVAGTAAAQTAGGEAGQESDPLWGVRAAQLEQDTAEEQQVTEKQQPKERPLCGQKGSRTLGPSCSKAELGVEPCRQNVSPGGAEHPQLLPHCHPEQPCQGHAQT